MGGGCYCCLLERDCTRYSHVIWAYMPDDSCNPHHRFECWGSDLLSMKDSPSHLCYADRQRWKSLGGRACVPIKHTSYTPAVTHAHKMKPVTHTYPAQEKKKISRNARKQEIVSMNKTVIRPLFLSLCASFNLCLKPPLWCYNPSSTSVTYSMCSK